jgi:putative ABC transport system ATP-binding protein
MSLIQTENLTKVYGSGEAAVTALDHVNLKIKKGEFVAIMGPSGCGKSTLLHLVGGLDRPTGGQLAVNGQRLDEMDENKLALFRRQTVGFIFQ